MTSCSRCSGSSSNSALEGLVQGADGQTLWNLLGRAGTANKARADAFHGAARRDARPTVAWGPENSDAIDGEDDLLEIAVRDVLEDLPTAERAAVELRGRVRGGRDCRPQSGGRSGRSSESSRRPASGPRLWARCERRVAMTNAGDPLGARWGWQHVGFLRNCPPRSTSGGLRGGRVGLARAPRSGAFLPRRATRPGSEAVGELVRVDAWNLRWPAASAATSLEEYVNSFPELDQAGPLARRLRGVPAAAAAAGWCAGHLSPAVRRQRRRGAGAGRRHRPPRADGVACPAGPAGVARRMPTAAAPRGHHLCGRSRTHGRSVPRLVSDKVCRRSGQAFVGFRLVGELGRGTFGRVYLARQANWPTGPSPSRWPRRLAGESQTLAQLQHTNIVPIYSVHRAGPLQAVCMPYFGGTTLADVLQVRRLAPLPPSGRGTVAGRRLPAVADPGGEPPNRAGERGEGPRRASPEPAERPRVASQALAA